VDDASRDLGGLPAPGTVIDGKYRLDAVIGRGGMAVVYAATQLLTHRPVAIKCLHPRVACSADVVERFLREARAATSIDHPNVVQVYDVGRIEGSFYLVMELLAGEALRDRIDRGPLPLDEALRVLVPVLGAVAAAHARGIVHRDLKPENVFLRLREDGSLRSPKVLDFGISKLTQEESMTLTGSVIGTPYYLSPEQATSSKDVGPASDVYQLGVLLFEMLTGRVPHEAPNYSALLIAILTEPPPALGALRPDLPPGVAAVVARAMAKSTSDRYPDVASFAAALAPYTDVYDEELRGRGQPAAPSPRDDSARVDALAATEARRASEVPPTRAFEAPPRDEHPRARRPRAIWLALAALMLVVGGVAGAGGASLIWPATSIEAAAGPPIAEPTGAGAEPIVPASPARLVRIESSPEAIVTIDGAPAGTTPLDVTLTDGPRTVTLIAAGHAPRELVLDPDGPAALRVDLDPIGAALPEPEAPAAHEPPHPRGGHGHTEGPRAGRLSADDF
jgi:hypothetical protein